MTSRQDEEHVNKYTRREGDANKTNLHKFKQINKSRKKTWILFENLKIQNKSTSVGGFRISLKI